MDPFTTTLLKELDAQQDEMAAARKQQDSGRSLEFRRGEHTGRERGFIISGMHIQSMNIAKAIGKALAAKGVQ